jgi:membrane-associated protease RseP (regulator of RpoE activity)
MFKSFLNVKTINKRILSIFVGSGAAGSKKAFDLELASEGRDSRGLTNNYLNYANYKGLPIDLIEKTKTDKDFERQSFIKNLFNPQAFGIIFKNLLSLDFHKLFFILSVFSKNQNKMICEASESKLYLGCSFRERIKEPFGLYVISVKSDSPAEKAGLKTKDLIVEIDGKMVTSLNEYNAAIGTQANKKKFKVLRKDENKENKYVPYELEVEFVSQQKF